MSKAQTGGEVGGLVAELQALAADAAELFGGLSPAQLNWKPSPAQWSVGQCFDHLIRTNECFFTDMRKVAAGEYRAGLWARVSPFSGLVAGYILGALDPSKGRRIKAPRVFRPAESDVGADVIERFGRNLSEAADLMRATGGADLRRTVLTSPASALATYSLLDAYRIVVAHGRRHFEQARKVTEAEGFPRG